MKKTVKNIVSIIIALTVVILSTMTAFAYSEVEDNDNFASANTISVNQTIDGVITNGSDEDYYKFVTPADGYVSLKIKHQYGNGRHHIYLYTYDGQDNFQLSHTNLFTDAEWASSANIGLPAGTYYIKVTGIKEYSFDLNFTQSDKWEKEYNNTFVDATPIALNTKFYGSSSVDGVEDDFFKVTTATDGKLSVDMWHVYGYTGKIYIYTYDGSSKEQITYTFVEAKTEKGTTKEFSLPEGTYYVKINTTNCADYQIRVNFTANTENSAPRPSERPTEAQTEIKPEKNENTRPATTPEANEEVTTQYYEEYTDAVNGEDASAEDTYAEEIAGQDEYYEEEVYDEYYDYDYDSSPSVSPIVLIIIISAAVVIIAAVCIVIVFVVKKK